MKPISIKKVIGVSVIVLAAASVYAIHRVWKQQQKKKKKYYDALKPNFVRFERDPIDM
jgi:preprotein translocase subunit YajC